MMKPRTQHSKPSLDIIQAVLDRLLETSSVALKFEEFPT